MPRPYHVPTWKAAPFIRLLLPLIAGILLQWYFQFYLSMIMMAMLSFFIAWLLFSLFPLAVKFKWGALQGFVLNALLVSVGLFLVWQKDIRHDNNWYGQYYQDSDYLVVRIDEPPIEKTKSFKAEGYVESIIRGDKVIPCKGKLLLYFSKDSLTAPLHYGDRILVNKDLQPIKNSGNPGAFNYQQYAAFQQIFHQVFLKEKDWVALDGKDINKFKQFIFTTRSAILAALQKNMPAGKDELGLAEALLIGYTNDLDKDLVQAYSNTGVVHIIAISGMHLALIYIMLVWIFSKIPGIKKSKLLQVVLILICLWLFSLLTGAAASVLRAAVMFSFISIGKYIAKQSTIYNSLASSAFVMLCYNPYFLWDVGFQLSYLAVVGIIVFQRPIYNLVYIKNKWVDEVWKLVSVSLAAQVLTFPICIYYFHQFPMLFLLANIIAVPLSSIILYAEIGLIIVAWIPVINIYAGKITAWLVWLMNTVIIWINHFSFAVWDKIPASIFSTILLYAIIIFFSAWLLNKSKRLLKLALAGSLLFVVNNAFTKWKVAQQQKLIVYNVPQHQAIDFVDGNTYKFAGDSILKENGLLQNFHLKPGRISLGLNNMNDSLKTVFQQNKFYQFNNKRILVINEPPAFEIPQQKVAVDIIIISKNTKLYIPQLAAVFNCNQYVFDGSNSLWKIERWQADCSALHLQSHSVAEKGAFVLNLEE